MPLLLAPPQEYVSQFWNLGAHPRRLQSCPLRVLGCNRAFLLGCTFPPCPWPKPHAYDVSGCSVHCSCDVCPLTLHHPPSRPLGDCGLGTSFLNFGSCAVGVSSAKQWYRWLWDHGCTPLTQPDSDEQQTAYAFAGLLLSWLTGWLVPLGRSLLGCVSLLLLHVLFRPLRRCPSWHLVSAGKGRLLYSQPCMVLRRAG